MIARHCISEGFWFWVFAIFIFIEIVAPVVVWGIAVKQIRKTGRGKHGNME
jgi:hypothetical protein